MKVESHLIVEEVVDTKMSLPVSDLQKWSIRAFGVGVFFFVLTFLSLFIFAKTLVFGAYLVVFLFFLSIALGAMFFVVLHFLTRAGWSVVFRRFAELVMTSFVASWGLPILFLLFIPIIVGLESLYIWLPQVGEKITDPIILNKMSYLNKPFFLIRASLFFGVWYVIAFFFTYHSFRQDKTGDLEHTNKLNKFSPLALLGFSLTLTFAAFDWIMSIDPHWFSSIFGVYYFSGSLVAIYAFLALFGIQLHKRGFLLDIITKEHFHDIGKLLFGFIVFWSYIAFSQFLLIWYANIPEETAWFDRRWSDGWGYLSLLLLFGHFVIPFFFLMSRHIKRRLHLLSIAAIWMLVMHFIDLYWLIMPNLYHNLEKQDIHFSWFHLIPLMTSFLGMGGLLMAVIAWRMKDISLIPKNDPRFSESISFENF